MIERFQGKYFGRSKSTAYKDLVWTVATAEDLTKDLKDQTISTLNVIENNLLELGTDKTKIVSAQIFLANIEDKKIMDKVWCEWIGNDSKNWPQRACLGVNLEGDVLIEVVVTAIR